MRRVVCVLFVAGCASSAARPAAPSAAGPASRPEEIAIAASDAPPDAVPAHLRGILAPKPAPGSKPAKVEGHLAYPVCVGKIDLKKERPRKASCCYPAKEVLVRPIRAVYPALRACFDARKNKDAEGRVVFDFRIEQSGNIDWICAGNATSVEDYDAVRCMVDEMKKVTFPAMSDEERDLCGLIKMSYPVIFEP